MSTPALDSPRARAGLIKQLARDAGFDLAGVAQVAPSTHGDDFRRWLAAGKHGSMHFLADTLDARIDLSSKFDWARSVVSVALAYHTPDDPAAPPAAAPAGKIARYARGRDYHTVMDKKLRAFERAVRAAIAGPITMRTWSDTGPIAEREYAQRAGLGWTGKSTLLIHPRHGTYFVLGELILSLELAPDVPLADHCGSCTRCIDACPTSAITPYSVDAVKCISYQTLENRGDIPAELHAPMRDTGWLIGCDICQDVCPFNRQPLTATDADFHPQGIASANGAVSLPVIQTWDEQAWDIATRGKAHRRAKHHMWQRNARVLAGTLPDAGVRADVPPAQKTMESTSCD